MVQVGRVQAQPLETGGLRDERAATAVVEIKSVEALTELHRAQLITYLRLGRFRLGLLLNFNVIRMTHGIRRVINSTARGG